MRRIGKVLVVLVLAPAPAVSQVSVAFLGSEDEAKLASAMDALEKSRDALLQARDAVDTALVEVDHALSMVRAAARKNSRLVEAQPSPPTVARPPTVIVSSRSFWSAVKDVSAAVAMNAGNWRRLLAAARDAASWLDGFRRGESIAFADAVSATERRAPSSASRPVLAVARDAEVTAASNVHVARSNPAQEALPPVPSAVAGPSLEPPPWGLEPASGDRTLDDVSLVRPRPMDVPTRDEPRDPMLPAVENSAAPTIAPPETRT